MRSARKSVNSTHASNVVAFPRRREEIEMPLAAPIVLIMSLALFLIYGAHNLVGASSELALLDRHYRIAYLSVDAQGVGR